MFMMLYQQSQVQSLLCLLYNVGRHKDHLPAFYSDSSVRVLIPFTRCPLGRIGLFSKCILSFLQPLMKDDELQYLQLHVDEISHFAGSLSSALQSDLTTDDFTAEEVLTILTNLSSAGINSSALSTEEILSAVNEFIQGSNEILRNLAIHLLLNLTEHSRKKMATIPNSTNSLLYEMRDDLLRDAGTLTHCLLHSLDEQGRHGKCFITHIL